MEQLVLGGGHGRDAPHDPHHRPNLAAIVFSVAGRRLFVDWERRASSLVAGLRQSVGQDPQDTALQELVARFRRDADFARLWNTHELRLCHATPYALDHATAGRLTLTQQALGIARSSEQTLLIMTAAPGSPSERALRELAAAPHHACDAPV